MTGASSGIGRAIAVRFAQEGAAAAVVEQALAGLGGLKTGLSVAAAVRLAAVTPHYLFVESYRPIFPSPRSARSSPSGRRRWSTASWHHRLARPSPEGGTP
jgi:hypothetical protein